MVGLIERHEDSIGLRVRNIILFDYEKFRTLISKEMKNEKIELNNLAIKHLVESPLAYIIELKRMQATELEVIKGYKFMLER